VVISIGPGGIGVGGPAGDSELAFPAHSQPLLSIPGQGRGE
jgi:hypothetical protein